MATATLDWSQCPAVESVPCKGSGARVFLDTRLPVATVIENWALRTRRCSYSLTTERHEK
jgi:uncharacterized protein (DUF433 family)